ncbi:hypothetical protein A2Z10_02645 [Candidatus Azambacteria bacterium RBG_16_47_10]|uniref:Type II secretion system protein GspG C-terminal domain-containing protein n=1 Tax=Candidatus Azambacteria bacterium RBG_16_47_10 TaxID=1797292 RepID=A0A1F5AZT7_9BACT|nr:MAG: hypothetical protein A2Z10_02645 [Candidatus Azambacteria bacterium RBG_16_47_10]
MDTVKRNHIITIAIIFFIVVAAVAIGSAIVKRKAAKQRVPMTVEQQQQETTAKLLATDPSDPSHVNNIKYIIGGLEKYYNDKKMYPAKLDDLVPKYLNIVPKYSSQKDYFYAYYPESKPTAYHIGTLLGGRNQSSPKAFAEDADLDSSKNGYVNGFNGMDPVYDLTGGKK